MSSRYFPQLVDAKTIKIIAGLYSTDPDYFTDKACPYDSEIKEIFIKPAPVEVAGKTTNPYDDIPLTELTDDSLIDEINALHHKLKGYWAQVESSDKSADKNTFFRVNTSLLERIVALREKMTNTLKINTFIAEVLSIMDEVLDADQRNLVVERLKQFGAGAKK